MCHVYDIQLDQDDIKRLTEKEKTENTKNAREETILLLRHRDMKRGQLEALLKHTCIIKKRKIYQHDPKTTPFL